MRKKLIIVLSLASASILLFFGVPKVLAVGGAAFTTFNPAVDGDTKDVCKNSIINCNIYGAKEYVWLNGGPDANHLKPDGYYFFAVLEPGGQPNPNDQGGVADKNLSDDYDCWENRVFRTEGGEVIEYLGFPSCGDPHWLDSGAGDPCKNGNGPNRCGDPDDLPPFIRLFPYSDTTNPGGVYIMAICYVGDDSSYDLYPVEPRDCKYDAFKVKKRATYDLMLQGCKFHDENADGLWDWGDEDGLPAWEITISGTGFEGEPINATVDTGEDGCWSYQKEYTFTGRDTPVAAVLTVCEVLQDGWVQSAPDTVSGCYDEIEIEPEGVAFVPDLDFGNYEPVSITAKKFYDRNWNGEKDEGESWIDDFLFCLYVGDENSTELVDSDDFVPDAEPDSDCQVTDGNGTVTWDGLYPGTYTVKEEDEDYWIPTTLTYATSTLSSGESVTHEFGNVAICDGLTPGYWYNWDNHYDRWQFESLLAGTIASTVDEAMDILHSEGCDGEDSLHCMRRFLLANQLTLNLTMYPDWHNDGAELYRACRLCQHPEVDEDLEFWLSEALAIHDQDGVDYTRDQILTVKTVLDWFANMNCRPPI
jgi:hypothetical protein